MKKRILAILFIVGLAATLIACKPKVKDKTLPNIEGLTVSEIREEFSSKGLIVTFDFQDYFVKDDTEKKFQKYGDNLVVGAEVNQGDTITIYINSSTIVLPNLTGLNRNQIIERFALVGVESRNLTIRPEENTSVEVGTFTRYEKNSTGDSYDFANKLVLYYDISKELPDLTNKNKQEIEVTLNDLHIDYSFEYKLDNTKEHDLFFEYENNKVGGRITSSDSVTVIINQNDNVNISDNIVNVKDIFISKYIDGINNNRAIELYNPTDKDIDLANYYIAILENGSLIATKEVELTGTLKPLQTYVIANDLSDKDLLLKANLKSSNLSFDGNDTIQLRRTETNTFIDSIYHVGNISMTMDEEIFIRRANIETNNRSFNQNDWIGFIPTYLDPVGTHPWDEADFVDPEFKLLNDIFANYGMTKINVTAVADGDTIYADSLDERDKTDFQGDNRIRFIMVDTPETQKPGVTGQPYAQVATTFTNRLLNGASEIYIQADTSGNLTDTYKRHLGLIWFKIDEDISFDNIAANGTVTIKAGWHLLNYELLKHGLGEKNIAKTNKYKEAPIFSNRYLYQWGNEADLYAKQNKLGLYSGVNRT